MNKKFDDILFLYVENIIVECLYYANKEVEKIQDIYIYVSFEGFDFFNVFYKLIDDKIYKKHKISEVIKSVDTTSDRQSQMNRKINKEIVDIKNLFVSDNREIPNQIRIQYKPLSGTNKIKFLYDKFHNDDLLIGDHEVFDEWFNQIQNGSDDLF